MKRFSPSIKSLVTLSLAVLLLLQGCGYTMALKGGVHPDSVRIGRIKNRAAEPRLDDLLKAALTDELMVHGVQIRRSSDYIVYGTLTGFEMKGLSETGGYFTEYEVKITGRFFLKGPDGESRQLRGEGPFTVYFSSQGDLTDINARKESAKVRAIRDLASEITASIIYPNEH